MESIEEKIQRVIPGAENMPGVVIIHELNSHSDFRTVYMSSKGLDGLGVSLKELQEMGPQYHEKFFNNEDMEGFMKKLEKLLEEGDPEQTFTFFQQVKLQERDEWVWHIGSLKIFHQDPKEKSIYTITMAFPVDHMKHIPHKAERLLAENNFYQNNQEKFENLGNRAKEVLRLVAIGKSSAEIASELNITVDTVNTHRKNIKKKLGITTSYEFTEYAHAFDLI